MKIFAMTFAGCLLAVFLVFPVILPGCGGSDDDDAGDDSGDDDSGGEVPCPNGPYDCEWTQGCHDGFCGPCTEASECHDMEGCLPDGTCGPCTETAQCEPGEACRHGFCMQGEVPLWELTMDPDDWQAMTENITEDTYYECALTVGDVTYDQDVECKLFGCSSRQYPKKGIRIKFPENADHPGFTRKINLKAEYNEPSLTRSFIAHETFKRLTRIPSSKTRYVRLNVNGQYYGLMIELERMAGKFLERHGRERDNSMYEAEEANPKGAFVPSQTEEEYRYLFNKKAGDDGDYSDLIAFVEDEIWQDYLDSGTTGPTSTTRVRRIVDIDQKLEYLAVMAIIQENDHVDNGFHFSWQADASDHLRWEFFPWDLNISFGCVFDMDLWDVTCDEPEYDHWWMNGVYAEGMMAGDQDYWANVLIHLLLKDPELYDQYVDNVCFMLDSEYWTQRLSELVEAIGETIWDAVEEDTNDQIESMDQFTDFQQGVLWFLEMRASYLKDQLGCP